MTCICLARRSSILGTENNLQILKNIYDYMKDKVEMRFGTSVTHIDQQDDGYLLETSRCRHCLPVSYRGAGSVRR